MTRSVRSRPRAVGVQPGLGSLANQVAFELGQGAEHVEHEFAAAGAGNDLLLPAHQPDAQLVELPAEQNQVVQRPPQPVEPPHRQHVAGARHLLWETWRDLETFTIVTAATNERMRAVHDRMPLILSPEQFEEWPPCLPSPSPDPSERARPLHSL